MKIHNTPKQPPNPTGSAQARTETRREEKGRAEPPPPNANPLLRRKSKFQASPMAATERTFHKHKRGAWYLLIRSLAFIPTQWEDVSSSLVTLMGVFAIIVLPVYWLAMLVAESLGSGIKNDLKVYTVIENAPLVSLIFDAFLFGAATAAAQANCWFFGLPHSNNHTAVWLAAFTHSWMPRVCRSTVNLLATALGLSILASFTTVLSFRTECDGLSGDIFYKYAGSVFAFILAVNLISGFTGVFITDSG